MKWKNKDIPGTVCVSHPVSCNFKTHFPDISAITVSNSISRKSHKWNILVCSIENLKSFLMIHRAAVARKIWKSHNQIYMMHHFSCYKYHFVWTDISWNANWDQNRKDPLRKGEKQSKMHKLCIIIIHQFWLTVCLLAWKTWVDPQSIN